jgi:hypothetical protein
MNHDDRVLRISAASDSKVDVRDSFAIKSMRL